MSELPHGSIEASVEPELEIKKESTHQVYLKMKFDEIGGKDKFKTIDGANPGDKPEA